jgi:hypothetical protein
VVDYRKVKLKHMSNILYGEVYGIQEIYPDSYEEEFAGIDWEMVECPGYKYYH